MMAKRWNIAIWFGLSLAIVIPLAAAGMSPQLNWRGPVYIVAGFAGIVGMALLLVQPLLAGRFLPDLSPRAHRKMHRLGGIALMLSVLVHVAGLWITSPPDMADALLLRSPTPFSIWGVLSMWALAGVALLALLKSRLSLRPKTWRRSHFALAALGAIACVLHAVQIEGTMEFFSKTILSVFVLIATGSLGFYLYKK